MGSGRESVARHTGTETLPRHYGWLQSLAMRESVTKQCRVRDEGPRVVNRESKEEGSVKSRV